MPKNAKIALAEDNPTTAKTIMEDLRYAEHEVVLFASDLTTALGQVNEYIPLGVQVALIDDNLRNNLALGYYDEDESDESDGEKIVRQIQKIAPEVTIVSISGTRQVPGSHLDIPKDTDDIANIGQIVDDIP